MKIVLTGFECGSATGSSEHGIEPQVSTKIYD
jgi:hypothetical protein